MSSRYRSLGLLLFFVVLLLAYKNYEIWSHPFEWVLQKEAAKKVESKTENPPSLEGPKEPPPRESFYVIAEKNIFNPDRKDFPSLTAEQTKPMVRPQIILYGIMIAGDYQTASVVNPGRPLHKGERELLTFKIGDRIGDYKLTKILPDRIIVEATGDSFEVLLYDPRSPKKRTEVKTPAKPAEVTSALPVSAPVPSAPPAPPKPPPPQVVPRTLEPTKEKVIEAPVPRPATPAPIPGQGTWRERRTIRPGAPVDNPGN